MKSLASSLALLGAILPLWSCSPTPTATVDRETFVQVYVELRVAALESSDANLAEEDRERILQRHGVSAEDLISFAEVHGADPDYMLSVWTEIEDRLNVDSIPAR